MKSKYLQQQVNTLDLVARYKMDSAGFDYSLTGNDGTVANAVPAYPGFAFDASGDKITCGSDSSIDNIFAGGGTVAAWVLSDGMGGANEGRAVGKAEWMCRMDTNTTTLKFIQKFTGDDGTWTFVIVSGVWFHIVIVYDNDAGANNPTVYVNGLPVTATETKTPGSDLNTSDATAAFVIGDSIGGGRGWDGKISDVMLFNTEISPPKAKSIYEVTRRKYSI